MCEEFVKHLKYDHCCTFKYALSYLQTHDKHESNGVTIKNIFMSEFQGAGELERKVIMVFTGTIMLFVRTVASYIVKHLVISLQHS
jgi:hypothetical protein